MRVLLVYSNLSRALMPAPPIGLSYIATAARNAGADVFFLDLNSVDDTDLALQRALEQHRPEVTGISVRNIDNVVKQKLQGHLDDLGRIVKAVRERSDCTIVLGGAAISILKQAVLRRIEADFAMVGEAERSFPMLLEAIASGSGLEQVPGLCYRKDGELVENPADILGDFGASGMEDWIDWPTYEKVGGTWAIQSKRGCSMPCTYCAYPVIEGRRYRRRDPVAVVDEIVRAQRQWSPGCFEIVDSTFNLPPDHALAVCKEIIRRGLEINLTAMGLNPAQLTAELLSTMRQAGFNSVMITPETASESMLKSLRKGFDLETVRRAARLARQSGLSVAWFFMLGAPGENRETVEETLTFVEDELGGRRNLSVVFTGIRILPGTQIARDCVANGTIEQTTDLSEPVFFISPDIEESWILERVNQLIRRRPNVVHAAEEEASFFTKVVHRLLQSVGIAAPYWRFLPHFLSLPVLRTLRSMQLSDTVVGKN